MNKIFYIAIFFFFSFRHFSGDAEFIPSKNNFTYYYPFSEKNIYYNLNFLGFKNEEIILNKLNYEIFFRNCYQLDDGIAYFDLEKKISCKNIINDKKLKKYTYIYGKNNINLLKTDYYISYFSINDISFYEIFMSLNLKIMFYSISNVKNIKIKNNYIKILLSKMIKTLKYFNIISNIGNYNMELLNSIIFPEYFITLRHTKKRYYKLSINFKTYNKNIKNIFTFFIDVDLNNIKIVSNKIFY